MPFVNQGDGSPDVAYALDHDLLNSRCVGIQGELVQIVGMSEVIDPDPDHHDSLPPSNRIFVHQGH